MGPGPSLVTFKPNMKKPNPFVLIADNDLWFSGLGLELTFSETLALGAGVEADAAGVNGVVACAVAVAVVIR